MKRALVAKFPQNLKAQRRLLKTGSKTLIEAAPNDKYWGVGKDGTGKNRLGHLLMEVRTELSEKKSED